MNCTISQSDLFVRNTTHCLGSHKGLLRDIHGSVSQRPTHQIGNTHPLYGLLLECLRDEREHRHHGLRVYVSFPITTITSRCLHERVQVIAGKEGSQRRHQQPFQSETEKGRNRKEGPSFVSLRHSYQQPVDTKSIVQKMRLSALDTRSGC